MDKIKQMPYEEKYALVTDSIKFDEAFIIPFVREKLGDNAVDELKMIWQEGMSPVPDEAPFEDKYETAYKNWIWVARNAYSFVCSKMSDEGLELFEREEAEALKRKNAGPALFFLNVIRVFSPGSAFNMIARQMAYQLQWITPFSVEELKQDKALMDIPGCKILDYPDTEDLCQHGCQKTYPMWVADQFRVKMEFNRQGNSCSCTLSPLR